MEEFNLAKEICKALETAKQEIKNNIYILKPDIIQKINILDHLLKRVNHTINFYADTNSIEICILEYVLDSCICDLKQVFLNVDLFVIDSLKTGQVSIEMKILNAAKIIRRK